MTTPTLVVDFCGETYEVDPARGFSIGRMADLCVDEENTFLHRRLVELTFNHGIWWVANVGTRIAITLSDTASHVQAVVSPGSAVPLALPSSVIRFSAGPSLYEVELELSEAPYHVSRADLDELVGDKTVAPLPLTASQHLLVVALAERALRRGTNGVTSLPSSAEAADRLGWPLSTFNRKLDAICEKLGRAGVAGLHGDSTKLASSRRARLVEHALSVRLVTADDLDLLPDRHR